MKFYLVDGEVRFLTHKLTWQEREENRELEFYDAEKKDLFVSRLNERNIDYAVIEIDQPSQGVRDMVIGKKFNTVVEAQAFIDGTLPLNPIDILGQRIFELETLVLQLGGSV